jgi:uncharacterized phage protein (TIGR02218 family)
MTMRPTGGCEAKRLHRGKTWCTVWRITRTDGTVYRFTDHDKTLTLEGQDYTPLRAPVAGDEHRESGIKEMSQPLGGILSDEALASEDLLAGRFDNATVEVGVVDWAAPWLMSIRSQKRWVQRVRLDSPVFRAEAEGLTAFLHSPVAGPSGGVWAPSCPFKLGQPIVAGKGCGVSTAADTKTGIVVDTVSDDRQVWTATSGSWGFSYDDDYYKDGEATFTTGDNAGVTRMLIRSRNGTREFTAFIPFPRPIQAGDTFTVRPGCDGQKMTCKNKWNNLVQFGGDPFTPGSSQILEPPL